MFTCRQLLFDDILLENLIYPLFMTARKTPTTNCFLYVRRSTKCRLCLFLDIFCFFMTSSRYRECTSGGVYVPCIYTHAKRVTVSDSGLCCCTCVTYLERLCVDSARALWDSICFRFKTLENLLYPLFMTARKNPTNLLTKM